MKVPDFHHQLPAGPRGSRSWLAASVAAVLALLLVGCSKAPASSLVVVDVIEMDMYSAESQTAAATGPVLEAGRTYTVTVEGTYSIWGSEWNWGVCEGDPDRSV